MTGGNLCRDMIQWLSAKMLQADAGQALGLLQEQAAGQHRRGPSQAGAVPGQPRQEGPLQLHPPEPLLQRGHSGAHRPSSESTQVQVHGGRMMRRHRPCPPLSPPSPPLRPPLHPPQELAHPLTRQAQNQQQVWQTAGTATTRLGTTHALPAQALCMPAPLLPGPPPNQIYPSPPGTLPVKSPPGSQSAGALQALLERHPPPFLQAGCCPQALAFSTLRTL